MKNRKFNFPIYPNSRSTAPAAYLCKNLEGPIKKGGDNFSCAEIALLALLLTFGIVFSVVGTAQACRRFWVEEMSSPVVMLLLGGGRV